MMNVLKNKVVYKEKLCYVTTMKGDAWLTKWAFRYKIHNKFISI